MSRLTLELKIALAVFVVVVLEQFQRNYVYHDLYLVHLSLSRLEKNSTNGAVAVHHIWSNIGLLHFFPFFN